jgi:hypothetical protein
MFGEDDDSARADDASAGANDEVYFIHQAVPPGRDAVPE